tara:strand:+ start:100 stop:444 length:345 start_codon:yes stop_codon:yes gene_type:complete
MSREEKRFFLNDESQIEPDSTEVVYMVANGDKTDELDPMAYLKISTSPNKKRSYYVKTYNSLILDPWGTYAGREASINTSFKTVSKDTYDYFAKYLKTKNSIYLTRAQRGFINA